MTARDRDTATRCVGVGRTRHDPAMRAPDTVSKRLLTGAAAGAVATGAMTTVLFAANRVVTGRRTPPVPSVEDAGAEAGPPPARLTPGRRVLAVATHIGIGCAAGATFALSRERIIPDQLPGSAAGAIHGLAVWAIGYLGVLPKLDVLPPPYRDDKRRAAAILAAHVAYGATVGTLVDIALQHRQRRR